MTAEIVVANFYALRDPDGFDRAVRLLVRRLRLQGMEGVTSYRFFGSGPHERRLVAIYDGAEAWVAHHDRIVAWPETVALRAAARLVRTDLYGPVPPPVLDWIPRLGLARMLRHNGIPVAGYPEAAHSRPAPMRFGGSAARRAG